MYPNGLLILPETLYSKYENSKKIKFEPTKRAVVEID
jgi:hypothetical protein